MIYKLMRLKEFSLRVSLKSENLQSQPLIWCVGITQQCVQGRASSGELVTNLVRLQHLCLQTEVSSFPWSLPTPCGKPLRTTKFGWQPSEFLYIAFKPSYRYQISWQSLAVNSCENVFLSLLTNKIIFLKILGICSFLPILWAWTLNIGNI